MSKSKICILICVILMSFTLFSCSSCSTGPENNCPNDPTNPSPSDSATSVSTNILLSWECSDPDNDPITYEVYFGTESDPPLVTSGLSDSNFDPGTLIEETKYYWKIKAVDDHSNYTTGNLWHFKTYMENNNPNDPTNPLPADSATSVSTNILLSWECSDPDSDAICYEVYFGTESDPPLVTSGLSDSNFDPGTLIEETKYYWKIKAVDDHSNSTTGDLWHFTTFSENNFKWCNVTSGVYTYGSNNIIKNIPYEYEIMKYEITNEQYIEFLEEAYIEGDISVTISTVEGYYEGDINFNAGNYELLDLDDTDCRIDWNGNDFTVVFGYEDHPVVEVTWFGAWAFAEHYNFRLPTQYEWEKAARGNTGYDYPWGNIISDSRANYLNSGDPFEGNDVKTTPIGMYNGQTIQGFSTTDSPSPYNAYDLAGNVWEWTDNWWNETSLFRIVRGGSWYCSPTFGLPAWDSNGYNPNSSSNYTGFRCVRP